MAAGNQAGAAPGNQAAATAASQAVTAASQTVTAASQHTTASSPDVRSLTLVSQVFGNTRSIRVHLPPGYDSTEAAGVRYPVLYLNDGFAVFSERSWNAPKQLDGLVRERSIRPLILIGIDNAASIPGAKNPAEDRANEYLPYPDASEPGLPSPRGRDYPRFLFGEVMPLVERTFRVDTAQVALGGSSYGAIAALFASLAAERPISALLLESPPLFLFEERLTGQVQATGRLPRTYIGIGTRETDDPAVLSKGAAAIDRFVQVAERAGAKVVVNRVEGASHNAAAWRARFPAALKALFGTGSTPGS